MAPLSTRSPRRAGDRPTDPAEIARLTRAEAAAYISDLGGGPSLRRRTPAGNSQVADVAADSHPRPYAHVEPVSSPSAEGDQVSTK